MPSPAEDWQSPQAGPPSNRITAAAYSCPPVASITINRGDFKASIPANFLIAAVSLSQISVPPSGRIATSNRRLETIAPPTHSSPIRHFPSKDWFASDSCLPDTGSGPGIHSSLAAFVATIFATLDLHRSAFTRSATNQYTSVYLSRSPGRTVTEVESQGGRYFLLSVATAVGSPEAQLRVPGACDTWGPDRQGIRRMSATERGLPRPPENIRAADFKRHSVSFTLDSDPPSQNFGRRFALLVSLHRRSVLKSLEPPDHRSHRLPPPSPLTSLVCRIPAPVSPPKAIRSSSIVRPARSASLRLWMNESTAEEFRAQWSRSSGAAGCVMASSLSNFCTR